jgi:hypothetical protein
MARLVPQRQPYRIGRGVRLMEYTVGKDVSNAHQLRARTQGAVKFGVTVETNLGRAYARYACALYTHGGSLLKLHAEVDYAA